MATVNESATWTNSVPETSPPSNERPVLHRVAAVRKQQGVSLRTAARQMQTDMATVRRQEDETTDLHISELLAWQRVLRVPLADLLEDPGAPLSTPVLNRARLVRLMKT